MANYGDDAPGPIIGGARRKPRALWRTRSDEDSDRTPLDEESPRRARRRVISVVRTSQTTVEEDDGQGDYEGGDYVDPDVLQSYYAVDQEEEDDDSSLGLLDLSVMSRSPSPQRFLGMQRGDENILGMARGVLPADMNVPPPEYVHPASVNVFGVVEGDYDVDDTFQLSAMDRGPPATPPAIPSASEAASVVKQSLSRLKQKIEDLTNMRVETRLLPGGQGASPQSPDRLLQQIQKEAEAKYQDEQKQFLKQERIRRCKRRILRKTLKQAIIRAMDEHRKGQRPGARRRAGIPVREGELISFSPTEVERQVQDFGADAGGLQPIGDNLMGFSPSPKRTKAVPPVGLFLDSPRLVAVQKGLDLSGNKGLSPEKQDFWWRSPEAQAFRRQVTPPRKPPSPPQMDLLTGEQRIPARRSAEWIPGVIPTCYG